MSSAAKGTRGPIERWCLRRCDRIVATCEAEKGWIEKYLGKRCPVVEMTDVKRFFDVSRKERKERKDDSRVDRVEGGVWSGYGGQLIYLKGYRDGTDEERVELLKNAIERIGK